MNGGEGEKGVWGGLILVLNFGHKNLKNITLLLLLTNKMQELLRNTSSAILTPNWHPPWECKNKMLKIL